MSRLAWRVPRHTSDILSTAATLARDSGLTVHVIVAREPGIVAQARSAARDTAGIAEVLEISGTSIWVRFPGQNRDAAIRPLPTPRKRRSRPLWPGTRVLASLIVNLIC